MKKNFSPARILFLFFVTAAILPLIIPAIPAEGAFTRRPGGTSPAFSQHFTSHGPGGGGGLYKPSISPRNSNLLLISCDMGGAYRSTDCGKNWYLIHSAQGLRATHLAPPPRYGTSRIYWVTARHTICFSDNGGQTWVTGPEGPWGKSPITDLLVLPGGIASPSEALLVSTEKGLWAGRGREWRAITEEAGGPLLWLEGAAYAALKGGRLYRSAEQGQSWQMLWQAPGQIVALAGAVATHDSASSAGVILASVAGHGIFRSVDKGASFSLCKAPYANETGLYMIPGRPDLAYAQQTGSVTTKEILKTEDGGQSWRSVFSMDKGGNVTPSWVQTELNWGYYFTPGGFALDARNPDFALAATQGDLYRTTDGGKSWQQIISEELPKLADGSRPRRGAGLEVTSCWGYYFDPHDPMREYIAYSDIGFARSVDKGESWIWAAAGSPWRNTFYDVQFDPERPGRIYAAASRRHDIPHYLELSRTFKGARAHGGGVIVSRDWGKSWKTPYTPKGPGALPDQVCTSVALDLASPPETRTIYAGIFGEDDDTAGVYKSTDNGASWTRLSPGPGAAPNLHVYRLALHPKNGRIFCLVTGLRAPGENFFRNPAGGIWTSADEGATWKHLSAGSPLNRWATAFAFDPKDENTIYVSAASPPGGAGVGGLYKWNGANWFHILKDKDIFRTAGPPNYDHCMAVAVSPENSRLLVVGTTLHGIIYSRDGGRVWRQYRDFPFTNAQSISFHPRDPGKIYVTTFGAGVWVGPSP